MNQSDHSETFVRQLTENQNRIYGYVYSLLAEHSSAADVVQETNLVLWRKIDEFEVDKPFLPWAFAVARFQVLAYLRDSKRDRLLLDEELVETIGEEMESPHTQIETIRESLRPCLQRLTPEHRHLVEHRYFKTMKVADIAEALGRTTSSVKVALLRIRQQLAECMQRNQQSERSK